MSRRLRSVIAAPLVILVAAFGGWVAWGWANGVVAGARSRAAAREDARGLSTQAAAWRLAAEARQARVEDLARLLLDAADGPEATAGLDALLRSWSGLHGAQVVSVEPLAGSVAGPLATVRLRIRIEGGAGAVFGVLEKVEHGPRLLTVERLRITAGADGLVVGDLTVAGLHAGAGTP